MYTVRLFPPPSSEITQASGAHLTLRVTDITFCLFHSYSHEGNCFLHVSLGKGENVCFNHAAFLHCSDHPCPEEILFLSQSWFLSHRGEFFSWLLVLFDLHCSGVFQFVGYFEIFCMKVCLVLLNE